MKVDVQRHDRYAKSFLLEVQVLEGHDPLWLTVDYDDVSHFSVDRQVNVLASLLGALEITEVEELEEDTARVTVYSSADISSVLRNPDRCVLTVEGVPWPEDPEEDRDGG